MGFLDDVEAAANRPIPGPGPSDETRREFDAMPVDALAGAFCALQYLSLRDQTLEIWDTILYFDHLPHDQPERAFALVLAVLRSEAHKAVKMALNDRFFSALIFAHGEAMIDEIEAEARRNPQLRWLIGGECAVANDAVRRRLEAVADQETWWTDYDAQQRPTVRIGFAKLGVTELAFAWVAQKCRPAKDHDDNWSALMTHESDLREHDPDRLIDLVLAVLQIESHPNVLALLAAGPMKDAIGARTIDRIEREASANEAFRDLLRGVWYWNESDDLKRRLDAITRLRYAKA